MDATVKEQLREAGADVAGTLARFMNNDALYERFLKRLPTDQGMISLRAAVAEKDPEKIGRVAHTIKGVSANLGLEPLAKIMDELVRLVRAGEVSGYEPLFEQSEVVYQKFCGIIENM